MIDCQNSPSKSGVAAGGAGGTDAAGEPESLADCSASATGPSRYPVGRAPRADCQFRIAVRVRGPNRPSAVPGSKPCAPSPGWICRRAERSRPNLSSTTGPLQPHARMRQPVPPRELHSDSARRALEVHRPAVPVAVTRVDRQRAHRCLGVGRHGKAGNAT